MDISALIPILLGWAVHLSPYPAPESPPQIVFQPHEFFVGAVCAGKECNVLGWYDDQNVVYIDEKFHDIPTDSTRETDFAKSLIVHEFVHFLQHQSGKFDSESCEDSIAREREAYYIQNEYLLQSKGSFNYIYPAPTACSK